MSQTTPPLTEENTQQAAPTVEADNEAFLSGGVPTITEQGIRQNIQYENAPIIQGYSEDDDEYQSLCCLTLAETIEKALTSTFLRGDYSYVLKCIKSEQIEPGKDNSEPMMVRLMGLDESILFDNKKVYSIDGEWGEFPSILVDGVNTPIVPIGCRLQTVALSVIKPSLMLNLFQGMVNVHKGNVSDESKEEFKRVFFWLHDLMIATNQHIGNMMSQGIVENYANIILHCFMIVIRLPNNNMWLIKLLLKTQISIPEQFINQLQQTNGISNSIYTLLRKHCNKTYIESSGEDEKEEETTPREIPIQPSSTKMSTSSSSSYLPDSFMIDFGTVKMNLSLQQGQTVQISKDTNGQVIVTMK